MSNESRGQRELQTVQRDGLRLLRGRGAQSAHALGRVKRNGKTRIERVWRGKKAEKRQRAEVAWLIKEEEEEEEKEVEEGVSSPAKEGTWRRRWCTPPGSPGPPRMHHRRRPRVACTHKQKETHLSITDGAVLRLLDGTPFWLNSE